MLNTELKSLPQNPEAESFVLGALLFTGADAYDRVSGIITAESFYSEKHQVIYEAITELYKNNRKIDLVTATQQLRKNNKLEIAGGHVYISQLAKPVYTAANIEEHAMLVKQEHIRRDLIKAGAETQQLARDNTTDIFDVVEKIQNDFSGLTEGIVAAESYSLNEILPRVVEEIEAASTAEGISGLSTGFAGIDAVLHGLMNSNLVILAARPGMGKTAFALQLALNISREGKDSVAFFSLEMCKEQLVKRLLSNESGVDHSKLLTGGILDHEWHWIHSGITKLSRGSLLIDDTSGINPFQLRVKARRLKRKHNIKAIIVDYLQLMRPNNSKSNKSREQEISEISGALKGIAKELNIPVVALAQLSRQVESRPNKKPRLSDLRESGSIEQDADQVVFLYRPEYYGFEEDENGNPTEGVCYFLVEKNRHGSTGEVGLGFDGNQLKFYDPNKKPIKPYQAEPF